MNTLTGSLAGQIHLISGVVALIFGGAVLIAKKGTQIHRKVGYLYVVSMAVLIISSFFIYRLFGKFGVFLFFSLTASFSLLAGMIPMFKKVKSPRDFENHFKRMYWSVAGLYAAFAAESFVRIPKFGGFWQAVAWSFVLAFVVCFVAFIKMRPVWSRKFGKGKN
jgi:uncharacterized membrane protein